MSLLLDAPPGLSSDATINAAGALLMLTAELAVARLALDEKRIPRGTWRYVWAGHPAPSGDDFVVISAQDYEIWRLRSKGNQP